MRRVGSFERLDFLQVGVIILDNLRSAAGLRPDHAVLDVGCGWGRLALPLSRFLAAEGRYAGVDVAAKAIDWCRAHIGAAHSNFAFHHIDAANSYANPSGAVPAERIRLLDGAEGFDRIVATSLFTHMLPAATENYLAQMAALCRPGGLIYATFFLLDEEAERLCAEGRSLIRFPAEHEGVRISNPAIPEDAVAYSPGWVRERLAALGFTAEIRKGFWSGRAEGGFDFQDVVIARRGADVQG
nr:class I SAM-dependent methyltransferase [Azospirillum sp. SYSU D00513]